MRRCPARPTEKHRYYLQQDLRRDADREKSGCPCFAVAVCFEGGKTREHICVGITLMEDASEYTFKIVLLGVIALVCILSFFILCASIQLLKILGETGNNVMMRLMGIDYVPFLGYN